MLTTNNLSTILLELLITKSAGNKGLKINTENASLINMLNVFNVDNKNSRATSIDAALLAHDAN